MKRFTLVFVVFFTFLLNSFSQCPQPGLKFQTAACNSASALKLDGMTCSTLKVKWQGDYNQKYIVKATRIYNSNNSTYDADPLNYTCDNDGNCEASIPVKPGSNVNWSVEGKCIQENGRLTGYSATGPQAYIPVCNATTPVAKTMKAYPNPTTGDLIVEFDGTITSNTQFMISDVSGKNTFQVSANSVTRINNGFKMNLHNLTNGTYFLKVTNAGETSQVKFVLIKN